MLAMETKNILDLAELIRSARIYVGCDSGPLHLSSAVATPSVALFGPKDPRTYGPYNPHHRVVLALPYPALDACQLESQPHHVVTRSGGLIQPQVDQLGNVFRKIRTDGFFASAKKPCWVTPARFHFA